MDTRDWDDDLDPEARTATMNTVRRALGLSERSTTVVTIIRPDVQAYLDAKAAARAAASVA